MSHYAQYVDEDYWVFGYAEGDHPPAPYMSTYGGPVIDPAKREREQLLWALFLAQ